MCSNAVRIKSSKWCFLDRRENQNADGTVFFPFLHRKHARLALTAMFSPFSSCNTRIAEQHLTTVPFIRPYWFPIEASPYD